MNGKFRRSVHLGGLFTIKHGYAFKGEHFGTEGSHIVLTPGNFFDEGGFKKKGDKEKWYSGKIPEDYILSRGDLLVAMTEQAEGLLGSSAIVPEGGRYLHNQRLGLIQNFKDVDKRFLYYLFNSQPVRQQIRASCSGVKVRHTSPSRIYEVKVDIPPLPTQRKIAAILSTYDDLIKNNLRRIKILEEMAQNLYREWFVKFRFPGHQRARFTDSVLGQIPEGWEVVPFTEIADVLSGGTPKTTVQEYWGGSIPFFTPKDAPESFYVTNTEKVVTELGLKKCNSRLYPKNTVFITARGTVGKVVMPSMNMAMNQSCYALCGKQGISQPYLFLATREHVDYLKKNTGGATFDTIIVDTFKKMPVAKPGNEVIGRFSQLIQPKLELILNMLKKNNSLRRTRDLLLPRLISGEVDVSSLDVTIPEEVGI
jgi:type I restriction enzyme, S subunit